MYIFLKKHKKTALTLVVVAVFLFVGSPILAQTDLQIAQSDRAALEAELAKLEAQIAEREKDLAEQKGQSVSISRDISILATQIADSKLKIQAKQLTIKKLSSEINHKQSTIVDLEDKLSREQESLAQMLRKTHEIDETPFVYVALGNDTVSEFYRDLDSFSTLNRSIQVSLNHVRNVKDQTETEKKDLEVKQDKEQDTKIELEEQKKLVETSQTQHKQLLTISKSKEEVISKYISETQAKVNQIKARLFQLAGGAQAIRFDQALIYAENASEKTNVDPAFLLAILTQESGIGKNVGQCYLTNAKTGAGVGKNTGTAFARVMAPTRDVPPFLQITEDLGMDPYKTPVSCPIAGVVGWGGAMGPAQFIASTWKIVEARVKSMLGSGTPNPWAPQDAFMASAIYLSDLGAKGTSYTAQMKAACKYYGSGGYTCGYGRSVLALKASIQSDIDYLNQYGVSRR